MKFVAAVLAVALVLSVAYAVHDRKQSTADIDESLHELRLTLEQAETDDALYSGGLIKSLIALRVETIKDTMVMLEQKRQSLLHRVCLDYRISGVGAKPAFAEELQHIQQDMSRTEKEIERARAEDAMYSGGLIKGLIAVRIATEQQTLAGLNQHYLFAKYGLPTLVPAQSRGQPVRQGQSFPTKARSDRRSRTKDVEVRTIDSGALGGQHSMIPTQPKRRAHRVVGSTARRPRAKSFINLDCPTVAAVTLTTDQPCSISAFMSIWVLTVKWLEPSVIARAPDRKKNVTPVTASPLGGASTALKFVATMLSFVTCPYLKFRLNRRSCGCKNRYHIDALK